MKQKKSALPGLPVLIVQHTEYEVPGLIGEYLESSGARVIVARMDRADALPDPATLSGLVVLGGPMSANDDDIHPWIRAELDLIRRVVALEIPIVGICLGGQMIARALGASIQKNHIPEIGWLPVKTTKKDPVLGVIRSGSLVYHWHGETFDLPPEAELLAFSEMCRHQAYRIRRENKTIAYGLQFHPEIDRTVVKQWLRQLECKEEIDRLQEVHGSQTVHDLERQLRDSLIGERSSHDLSRALAEFITQSKFKVKPRVQKAKPRLPQKRSKK